MGSINTQTLRAIDYWIGKPLLFVLSLFQSMLNIFIKVREDKKNIIFIQLSEMGSITLALQSFEMCRKEGFDVYLLTFFQNKALVENTHFFKPENVFYIQSKTLFSFLCSSLSYAIWSLKGRFVCVVDFEIFARVSAVLSFLTFSKYRVGFKNKFQEGLYRGSLLNISSAYNPRIHISSNFLTLTKAALLKENFPKILPHEMKAVSTAHFYNKYYKKSPHALCSLNNKYSLDVLRKSGKLLVVNPDSGPHLLQRTYPVESMAEVIKILLETDTALNVILIGTSSHIENNKNLMRILQGSAIFNRVLNTTDELTLEELLTLFTQSDTLLTADSGPSHFAAFCSLPQVVMFGPESPFLYAPLGQSTILYKGLSCSPCVTAYNHRNTNCVDNQCLKKIMPSEVVQAVSKSLLVNKSVERYVENSI